jgi:hypothetical protein
MNNTGTTRSTMPVRNQSEGVFQLPELNRNMLEREPDGPSKQLSSLELHPDNTGTYGALCTFIRFYESSHRTNIGDLSEKDLYDLLDWLDTKNIDILSHCDFPSSYSGEEELEKAIALLARLQNLLVLVGATVHQAPTIEDITKYCLVSRKDKPSRYNLGE